MIIPSTKSTPKVTFNFDEKSLEFIGILCPENPTLFFTPILNELKKYIMENSSLKFKIQLDYFNSGSSKCLLTLFKTISEVEHLKKHSSVHWVTETNDEDLIEAGKLFEEITGLKFEYVNN